jgi:hypothetical protein
LYKRNEKGGKNFVFLFCWVKLVGSASDGEKVKCPKNPSLGGRAEWGFRQKLERHFTKALGFTSGYKKSKKQKSGKPHVPSAQNK